MEKKEYDRTWLSEAERLEVWDVVPETAVIMTFLQEEYDVVNGEKVHRDYKKTAYESHRTKVFVQDGKFCMDAGWDALVEIPLDAFGTARKQPRTTFHYWMQSKSVDSEEYQPYQIEKLGHGNFSCEYYYVPIKYEGREYSLLVPAYEIKPFQQLTGVAVDFQ